MPIYEFESKYPTYFSELKEDFDDPNRLRTWLIKEITTHPHQKVEDFAQCLFSQLQVKEDWQWSMIQKYPENLPRGEELEILTIDYDKSGNVNLEYSNSAHVRFDTLLIINGDYAVPVYDLTKGTDPYIDVYLFVSHEKGQVITIPKKGTYVDTRITMRNQLRTSAGIYLTGRTNHSIHELKKPGDAYMLVQRIEEEQTREERILFNFALLWLPESYSWMEHLGLE